ncbi:MAG: hypothetical protein ACKOZW_09565, partial [Cyanobium sp.]
LLLAALLAGTTLLRGALAPLGRGASPLLLLWGVSGLLRGAAAPLRGERPKRRLWGLMLRRNGRGCRRLLGAALLGLGLMALATLPGYALVALSARFAPSTDLITTLVVALLPLAPALVLLHLLPLGPLLALHDQPLLASARRSLELVRRRPGTVLVLGAVQLAILGLSVGIHPLVGVVLGLPLAICLGTAAPCSLSREAGC